MAITAPFNEGITMPPFPDPVQRALTGVHHLSDDEVLRLSRQYELARQLQSDFPPIDNLTEIDVPWIMHVDRVLDGSNPLTYAELKAKVQADEEQTHQSTNIGLPVYNDSPWEKDSAATFGTSLEVLPYFTQYSSVSSPQDLDLPFTKYAKLCELLTEKVAKDFSGILLNPAGSNTKTPFEQRHGRTIVMMAGLGTKALRAAARQLVTKDPGWAKLDTDDRKLVIASVISAWRHTGYPASWMRMPFVSAARFINNSTSYCYATAVRALFHVLGHARISLVIGAKPRLFIAYDGNFAQIDLDPADVHLPLAQQKPTVLKAILSVLKLKLKVGRETNQTVNAVLQAIHVHHLLVMEDPAVSAQVVVGPSVLITQDPDTKQDPVAAPEVKAIGIATIDQATGMVDPNGVLRGEDVLRMDLRPQRARSDQDTKFVNTLPSQVLPGSPAGILLGHIHNLVHLGYPVGMRALLDAILVLDFLRGSQQLRGPVAGVVGIEFPPIIVLANAATAEGTTNQGKTTLGRGIGNVMVPGLREVVFNRQSGAPAARSLSMVISEFGTALYDEFIMPTAADHPLGKEGIQGLSTGGAIAPGRAMENAKPITLRHSLILCAKIAAFAPDILNRGLMFFLDPIHATNGCTPAELNDLMNGKISTQARLSMIRWIQSEGVVDRIASLTLSNTWRFNATAAVAEMFAGSEAAQVQGYLKASYDRAITLRQAADVSTLATDLGIDQSFSLAGLVDLRSTEELGLLAQECQAKGGLRIADAVIRLYVGYTASSNSLDPKADLTREYRRSFHSITALAGRQLAEHPLEMHGYRISRIQRKNGHGEPISHVMVEPVVKA